VSELSQLVPAAAGGQGLPYGRVPFAFGRRFFLLLLIGLVWLGPAWADPRYLYVMVVWDISVVALWAWDLERLPKPSQLECRRMWSTPLQLGVEASVTFELRNTGHLAIEAQVFDDVPRSLGHAMPQMVVPVLPGRTERASYPVRPRERGDARMGSAFLRYQSPWRIAERWAEVELGQPIRVYPNIEESKHDTIYLIRSRQIAMEMRHKRLPGQGREFQSLREHHAGDEWRDICWSATARRGKLVTREYQIERSQTVWLVLDTGRLLRTRVLGLSKLDYAIGAALSLAQVALYSGDQVAMLAYGRHVQKRLPAGRGARQVRALLEGLAQVREEESEADHLRAAEALLTFQKRRSLVVWLTDLAETSATPDVIESACHLAHRHLVLFTVISQPELRALLDTRPTDKLETYRYIAAREIVNRREVLLETLRQQGALTLEIEPARLSSAVVNQYLTAKERSLV
jgi:uncharacterized protein (DUF58 family)